MVDGFTIGTFVSDDDCGDAWVEAPDGAIATLIWEAFETTYFREYITRTRAAGGAPTRCNSRCR